ncbi:MAG: hypothetical protein GVY08_05785 [Bacteroidetes bacterium]|jgi:hypothetical protein|nr:hypothetical protein [Bacteroidota bacterium]
MLRKGLWKELYMSLVIAKSYRMVTSPSRAFASAAFRRSRSVLCDPFSLRMGMVLPRIFAYNGYRPVFDPTAPYDISFQIPTTDGKPCINCNHVDNKKTRVAKTWEHIAGYPLMVDPASYSGLMVEKSEANSTHDGRVIEGPLPEDEIREDKAYQILIDNSVGDEIVDYRVTFYGGNIPLVFEKYRSIDIRFSNDVSRVEYNDPTVYFSDEEIKQLNKHAELSGLHYGEADVLRDNKSGRIYVVDSTNGPGTEAGHLTLDQQIEVLDILSSAFDEMVENLIRESSS